MASPKHTPTTCRGGVTGWQVKPTVSENDADALHICAPWRHRATDICGERLSERAAGVQ
jgi:hypothetical protein